LWLLGAAVGVGLLLPRAALAVQVVLLKRAGVTAYEEVTEEFGERCRVRVRVVSFGDEGPSEAMARIRPDDLVVTVGQEALDAVRNAHAHVIPTLAFHTPGLVGPPSAPPPELLLRVLTTARSSVHTIATVYGPRSQEGARVADQAARRLGLALVTRQVKSGPEAVRALRALVDPDPSGGPVVPIDAIWLPGDTDVVTPQVFQYALRLQLERGLPLVAATRHQVHSGALVAVDFSPRSAGRTAADLANRYLDGAGLSARDDLDLYGGARVTVNAQVARRLGADREALERLGARIE
jgi:hypothetical protein